MTTKTSKISLTYPADTHTRPMGNTPIDASNKNITDSQRQALDKGRQMETIRKGNLDQKNSCPSWLVTTIKKITRKPVKELVIPVLTFNRTHEAVFQNSSLLADFDGKLDVEMESQKESPLYYGSEFRDITGIIKLFSHDEEKYRIVDIIQKGSRYHISPIKEATSKSYMEAMLLRSNHKSEKSGLNAEVLEK